MKRLLRRSTGWNSPTPFLLPRLIALLLDLLEVFLSIADFLLELLGPLQKRMLLIIPGVGLQSLGQHFLQK